MNKNAIWHIPKDRTVTYALSVVDYRPQKSDQYRVLVTVSGNLLNVPGYLSTRTSETTTSKLLFNSVISTDESRFACIDIKNMYLQTPMDRKEYMRIPIKLIPQEFMDWYKLQDKIHNGHIYCKICRGIYGLPQVGKLSNDLLRKRLATCGYFECTHTPGLWRHIWRPVTFTLVVDDFGVKLIGIEQLKHIIASLKKSTR